ncbi:hydrogenase expression/formation protein HypE [Crossiella sp. CA198]|uniref:hydrogenase expression/formation protein HypE n=1 Tax=Crossiella sp. CA198 TaxID=3455607 RepID=UPI003F8D7499
MNPPDTPRIMLDQDGGLALARLLDETVRAELGLPKPPQDAAVFPVTAGPVALSVDAYVAAPRFFPGGDLGSLAVHGTINNLAMRGAGPVALGLAYVVEEGLPEPELHRVTASAARAARSAGVPVVTGDTKIVPRGAVDGLQLTATGLGVTLTNAPPTAGRGLPGDVVVLSGPIGLHGAAMLDARDELGLAVSIRSDTLPLHRLVAAMTAAGGGGVHALRDPARGGLAGALTGLAGAAGVGIELFEAAVPVPVEVIAAGKVFEADPWELPCAGCLVALLRPAAAERVLAAMRAEPGGGQATVIGEVTPGPAGQVTAWTVGGVARQVEPPAAARFARLF